MAENSIPDSTTEFSTNQIVLGRTRWERDTEKTPVYAVISAVEDVTGSDVLELPPLHEALDPDALNGLFTSCPNPGQVRFQYAGYEVAVHASGDVHVLSSHDS